METSISNLARVVASHRTGTGTSDEHPFGPPIGPLQDDKQSFAATAKVIAQALPTIGFRSDAGTLRQVVS